MSVQVLTGVNMDVSIQMEGSSAHVEVAGSSHRMDSHA